MNYRTILGWAVTLTAPHVLVLAEIAKHYDRKGENEEHRTREIEGTKKI